MSEQPEQRCVHCDKWVQHTITLESTRAIVGVRIQVCEPCLDRVFPLPIRATPHISIFRIVEPDMSRDDRRFLP